MAKKHKPEEVVAKLRQVDVLTSQGAPIADAIRSIGVTEVTYYRWRNEYGGLKSDQVKRDHAWLCACGLTLVHWAIGSVGGRVLLAHRAGPAECSNSEEDIMPEGRRAGDHAPEFKHVDDMEWEMGRFRNKTKFLFHPRPDCPTEPNAGLLRYEPGASFPLHRHDFAQVWYVLEGEFCCGGTTYGPGTFVYMADPHFEHEMTTKSGGTVVFLQYPGPTTGARPIYDGRMNLKAPESPEQYDLTR